MRYGVFSPLLGHGIFTQEGAAWRHSRELLRKQFAQIQYQNLENYREHVDNLIAALPISDSDVIDLQPFFFKFTLDTTTALLLGKSAYSLKAAAMTDASIRSFTEGFDEAQGGLAKRFRLAPWHFFYSPPRFRKACSAVHQFVDDYIRDTRLRKDTAIGKKSNNSFIDQLAHESTDPKALRYQLLNILLAGRDTTACCLSWTL